MGVRIQHRRDIAANWITENPVLAAGEIGLETDTNRIKIGDGVSTYAVLAYGPAVESAIQSHFDASDFPGPVSVGIVVIWSEGKVRFFSSQSGKIVTVNYNYATTSTFYIRPMPGKILVVEDAECDTSCDVIMTDTISYSSWYFDGTQFVKGMQASFKRAGQIMVEARGAFPIYVEKGATEAEKLITDIEEFRLKSRGMKFGRQAAPFVYKTAKDLRSSYLQEVRVQTKHHRPMGGEHVTMTFYCSERDE